MYGLWFDYCSSASFYRELLFDSAPYADSQNADALVGELFLFYLLALPASYAITSVASLLACESASAGGT